MSSIATPRKYPVSLSQGEGGPSRRPTRTQPPIPSIDDVLPSPPLSKFHPIPHPATATSNQEPTGTIKTAKSVPVLKKSASRPLNPDSKPYIPQQFRQPPAQSFALADSRAPGTQTDENAYQAFGIYPHSSIQTTQYPNIHGFQQNPMYHYALQQSMYQQSHQTQPFSSRPEYTSLQHLLEQAGYSETRIMTPPAEKTGRRIKKTFDEVDAEELPDLYSTYGMAGEHRVSHITEPGLPFKSSSSILRNVAMKDNIQHGINAGSPPAEGYVSRGGADQGAELGNSYDKWWRGGLDVLGRAAKAVMEMSPPSKPHERFEEVGRQVSVGLGLGLAKGGEGVRKVKSNWELGGPRDEYRDQEQIPPVLDDASPTRPVERRLAIAHKSAGSTGAAPPPSAVEDEEFGFSPLPADYEAQCDDDDFFATSFDVGSAGSSPVDSLRNSPDREFQPVLPAASDDQAVEKNLSSPPPQDGDSSLSSTAGSYKSLGFGLGKYELNSDVGKRVMATAVDYDDVDDQSPTKKPAVRPFNPRSHTSPESPPPPALVFPTLSADTPVPTTAKPALKYGDRAAKLRQAKSTPLLIQARPESSSWYGSIKNYIFASPTAGYSAIPTESVPTSSRPAPLKLSPALPAAPTLATSTAVVCDSTSDLAEDLPAIPAVITITEPAGMMSSIALKTRQSLAQLRSAWMGSAPPPPLPNSRPNKTASDDVSPVLSPRLDLSQGEFFAGWSPTRIDRSEAGVETDGYGPTEIDYTKSFFYKPATPPSAVSASNADADPTDAAGGPVARRQRSIKSLRAALLLPVAPPPVPAIPAIFIDSTHTQRSASAQTSSTVSSSKTSPELATPPMKATSIIAEPPVLAILSPGAWEAGLPPRELVLEGEEWDAKDGAAVGSWSRRGSVESMVMGKGKGKDNAPKKLKRKNSKKAVRAQEV